MKSHFSLHTLLLAISLLSATLMIACGSPKVEDEVKNSDALCPIEVGRTGEVTDISQGDTAVIFTLKVNEDSVTLDSTFLEVKKAEALLSTILKGKKDKVRSLLKAMVSQGKGLRFHYIGSKSGRTIQVAISGKRIRQIVDEKGRPIPDPDRKIRLAATDSLQAIVSQAGKGLPRNLRQGIQLREVKLEGGYVVYAFILDGMGLSLERVENNPQAVKSELIPLLPAIDQIKQYSQEACIGLIMRFSPKPSKAKPAPRPKPTKDQKDKKSKRPKPQAIILTPEEFNGQ